tara:strand:- start:220 stop:429 length:210 start_codon:yes stop_codon:yes gene_type:complete
MINNTPLAMLKSDTAMAVKAQKAMNAALAGNLDLDRYNRANDLMDLATKAPDFDWGEFKRICKAYGVMF